MRELFNLFGTISINGLEAAQKGMASFEKQVSKSIRPVEKFGKQVAKVGDTFTRTFTIPLALAGGAIVKFGSDFEKSMATSLAIMGDVSDSMKSEMEATAREVSKTTTVSANESAKAYYYLASAGYSAAQAISALPTVAKFAEAGQFNLQLATDLLTDAQSALGLATKDVAENEENLVRVSDVLVKANTLANASVQQFSESLTNRAGAALRIVGKDVEEGVAVLAAYADQGTKGAEAGTQLGIVMRDLQKAALGNKDVFSKYNISVYDSAGEMRNMADILGDLERALDGMSDEQKKATLQTMDFQEKSVASLLTLIGTSDKIREYEAELRKAGGTTEKVAKSQMQNFQDQLKIVKNNLIDVGLTLWDVIEPAITKKLIPALRSGVSNLSDFANWFKNLPEGFKNTTVGIFAFLAVAGPALVIIGKIIASIKVVTTVFTAAKLAVIAFNAAVASNPYALAVVAIGAFTTAIYGAVNAYKDLQREHQKFTVMTTEQAAVKAFIAGVDSLIDKVKEYGDVLNDEAKLNELLGDTVDTLVDQARELGYTIEGNNKKKIESLNIIALELQGVRDQTGALIKYNAEAETTNEKVDKRKKLTEEEIEALKKLAEMREKVEQEYSDKVAELTLNRLELLDREREAAITKAQEIGADTTQIEQYYALQRENIISEENQKRIDRSQERKDAIAALEKQWSDALAGQTMTRLELIEREKQNAIAKAEEAGASTADIVAYYEKLKQDEIDRTSQKTKDQAREWVSGFRDAARQFIGLFQDVTDNRIAQLDNWEARERAAIENSTMLEKQKATALQKLDKDAAKKRRELQREQAKRDKAAALFSTIINTAQAVSKALTLAFPLNIIMSALVGVLGAVQIGIIAAKPLPFKKGGFIRGGRGGVLGEIGEGDEDEIVMPLKTGVGMLADKFIEAISNSQLSSSGTPVAAVAGGGQSNAYMPQVVHQWHIGALIADDAGIKELERRQRPIRIAEEQRMGLR